MSRAISLPDQLAVLVPQKEAKAAISWIMASDLLDKERKVLSKDGLVEIPVRGPVPDMPSVSQLAPKFYRRPSTLADILRDSLTPEELDLLPRGWTILGEVIILKIHPSLEKHKHRIGQALLERYSRCRCVLLDLGIAGQMREPRREVIAGGGTETIHRENGVLFKMDAAKVMFSAGNLRERMRMGRLGKDERVLDMFAGIGYFALPMAVHSRPEKILAVEINPVAYDYLDENIRLNRVAGIVETVLGDCSKNAPTGWADRVIMGLVGETAKYIETGISALRPGGTIHYHQTVPSWLFPFALEGKVMSAAKRLGRDAEILQTLRVKKYSPGVVHGVVDARIN